MDAFKNAVGDFYDKLPRWVRVTFWMAVATVVDGIIGAVQTGQVTINPVLIPIINIVLVAIKDWINSRQKDDGSTAT